MKVKVGNKIFDADHERVMLILTEKDKQNIANMSPDATKYCAFPDSENEQDIETWMEIESDGY